MTIKDLRAAVDACTTAIGAALDAQTALQSSIFNRIAMDFVTELREERRRMERAIQFRLDTGETE
jgi:hypothetical protein